MASITECLLGMAEDNFHVSMFLSLQLQYENGLVLQHGLCNPAQNLGCLLMILACTEDHGFTAVFIHAKSNKATIGIVILIESQRFIGTIQIPTLTQTGRTERPANLPGQINNIT